MEISVLIPTKNEPLINELIKEVHKNLKKWTHEIIIIDKSKTKPQWLHVCPPTIKLR